MLLVEAAIPFVEAAVRAHGAAVLGTAPEAGAETPAAVGCRLLKEIFGAQAAGMQLPEPLAALVGDPDDAGALAALDRQVDEALDDDPRLKAVFGDALTGFYRQGIEAGDTESMLQLGDLRRRQRDFEGARVAYQQAIDSGSMRAVLSLARLMEGYLHDADVARAWYQRVIDSGDADLAPEAMVGLGHLLVWFQRDAAGARVAFGQAIGSGHPEWAPAGMAGLGHLLKRQGDAAGARAAFGQAIESGNPGWSGHALIGLGEMLEQKGDAAGARAMYWRAVESRTPPWAAHAFTNLVNMLRWQDDADGLRAAHRRAVETGNPDASYSLTILGQILSQRGDDEGARAVLQEAVAAGDEMAQEVLADIARKNEPRRVPRLGGSEPTDLPEQFDPGRMRETGIAVLEHGLPALPEALTYQMSVPVAYWKAERCAVVLFLAGSPAMVVHGRVGPAVAHLVLTQDGHEDRRRLESHFGAWVVCTEQSSNFQVAALDENGIVLASIDESFPPE